MKRLKKCVALLLVTILMLNLTPAFAIESSLFDDVSLAEGDSIRRQNYYALLEGKYFAVEFIDEFEKLFGNQYKADDIKENYTKIFGIEKNEMDEAVLNLLVKHYNDIEQAEAKGATRNRTETESDNGEFIIPEYVYDTPPKIESPEPEIVFEFEILEASGFETEVSEVQLGDEPVMRAPATSGIANPASSNNSYSSVSYVSRTNTSITVDIWYKTNNSGNNILYLYNTKTGSWSCLLGRDGMPPATSQRFVVNGLEPGVVYTIQTKTYDSNTWNSAEIKVKTSGEKTPSLTLLSSNGTSVTLRAVFPADGVWGNKLSYYSGTEWVNVNNSLYLNGQDFTITGLNYGYNYVFTLSSHDHLHSVWNTDIQVGHTVPLPPENLQSFQKLYLDYELDAVLVNTFSAGRLNTFLDKLDVAYLKQLGLVRSMPNSVGRMEFITSRTLPTGVEGRSGYPIQWSVVTAISHVKRMNQLNANIAETPIHEIGHNFDKPSWTFEAEAQTIFKIYHYMDQTNDRMAVSNYDQVIIGGSGYLTYMKSGVYRTNNHINYDAAMSQSIYSPYSLAYRLSKIAEEIGWEPFQNTYLYFDELPWQQTPTTSIGKFNLFMSKLREFSGVDVLARFTSQEKAIFGTKLGGTIEYYKAIVIIPGTTGSSIENYQTGERVWLAPIADKLALYENGDAVHPTTSMNDDNYGVFNTYQNVYNKMVEAFGTQYDVIFYDYDWRMTNTTAANNLTARLSMYSEVVLVCHSMGGIVASKWLSSSVANQNKTQVLITAGTPYVGAAKSINTMETGELITIYPLQLYKASFKAFCKNSYGAYELLPSSRYYSTTGEYPISISGTNYANTTFLQNAAWCKTASGNAKPQLSAANNFHDSLYSNGVHITDRTTVPVHRFASTGELTISRVNLNSQYEISWLSTVNRGDGTVILESATLGDTNHIYSGNIDHTGMIKNTTVLTDMVNVISSEIGVSPSRAATVDSSLRQAESVQRLRPEDIVVNARGWMENSNTQVISIAADSDIQIFANGAEVVADGENLFDSSGEKVGVIWSIGATGSKLYVLEAGEFEVVGDGKLRIEYVDAGYYEKIVEYDIDNEASIYVSNFDTMEVECRFSSKAKTNGELISPNRILSDSELAILNQD